MLRILSAPQRPLPFHAHTHPGFKTTWRCTARAAAARHAAPPPPTTAPLDLVQYVVKMYVCPLGPTHARRETTVDWTRAGNRKKPCVRIFTLAAHRLIFFHIYIDLFICENAPSIGADSRARSPPVIPVRTITLRTRLVRVTARTFSLATTAWAAAAHC